ncbi:tyrosine-type recombinase/integrase [Brevundimonas nasdae]|uniref:tyrosine-type recombinase/integrase n=1 Tax=Brevundimonas nasdae TaxID=172043 RepID=UPI00289A310C|nr:integrase arm-type DNA-binding domain-containing protein [Brevundimonas nasdae]
MAREINRLSAVKIRSLKEPGLHADGNGLYLRIDQTGARRWVFVFYLSGRRREMGLGSVEAVSLKDARAALTTAREILRAGDDPIAARRTPVAPERAPLFSEVAGALMDSLEPSWKSPKQRGQWEASLKQHAPAIWKAEITSVDTTMVLAALQPIWLTLPETATRLRSRIERVLDTAKVKGQRQGENPARLRGHLDALLPRVKRIRGHHAAMPYESVPTFLKQLSARQSESANALRFLIFTGVRSGEVRGATWEEINGSVWTIPAERMKAGKTHRVPLSSAALGVLDDIDPIDRTGLIFCGAKGGKLSDMALAMVMRKMGISDATPHGFRSSFRDWAGDCTTYPRELLEEALAHNVGNAVERAYRRGTAFEKRRALMNDWADHCLGISRADNVYSLKA